MAEGTETARRLGREQLLAALPLVLARFGREFRGFAARAPGSTKPPCYAGYCPTKLLTDSGACISVISYEFVKEVLHDDAHPEMTPSTFPEVHTVRGEKLPTIGQIQVTLLLNGRQFPSQFNVITNMAYQAVLGREFRQSNGAIINYSEANIKVRHDDPTRRKFTSCSYSYRRKDQPCC